MSDQSRQIARRSDLLSPRLVGCPTSAPSAPAMRPKSRTSALRTADAGADGTGVFDDDAIWAEIFVLPYVHRHPDLAFVVEADDGRVVGYIVCAPDTDAFRDCTSRHPSRTPVRSRSTLASGSRRSRRMTVSGPSGWISRRTARALSAGRSLARMDD